MPPGNKRPDDKLKLFAVGTAMERQANKKILKAVGLCFY